MKKNSVITNIRSMIFGMEDGFVSIWGLVLGVSAGLQSSTAVIIAGLAGTIPAALSMAAGEYLSSKSKREVQEKEITDVSTFVKEDKKNALSLLRKRYQEEGLHKKEIDVLITHMRKDKKLLIRKLQEEFGALPERFEQPGTNAIIMFFSFIIAALFPIGPFFFLPIAAAQKTTLVLTSIGLFCIGAVKTKWTGKDWITSGFEMLLIGLAAALTGYMIGSWLG